MQTPSQQIQRFTAAPSGSDRSDASLQPRVPQDLIDPILHCSPPQDLIDPMLHCSPPQDLIDPMQSKSINRMRRLPRKRVLQQPQGSGAAMLQPPAGIQVRSGLHGDPSHTMHVLQVRSEEGGEVGGNAFCGSKGTKEAKEAKRRGGRGKMCDEGDEGSEG